LVCPDASLNGYIELSGVPRMACLSGKCIETLQYI
jgi:hypothetical protein